MADDRYAGIAGTKVTANGATITYNGLLTGIGLGTKKGMLIDKIEYIYPAGDLDALTTGQGIVLAWTVQDSLTSLTLTNRGVIHYSQVNCAIFGAAANAVLEVQPFEYFFTPPIIVAEPEIFLTVQGPAGAAGEYLSRFYYRYIDLRDVDFLEIAQSFNLIG